MMREEIAMRTTLTIDDDVLCAAKNLAARQHRTVGDVISALAREALRRGPTGASRNAAPLLAVHTDATPVTPELVNQLRDEIP
jgi:hypothetical protein